MILGMMIKTWKFVQSSPSKSLTLDYLGVSTSSLRLPLQAFFPLCQVTRMIELLYLLHITTSEWTVAYCNHYQKSCILTHCISTHISKDETNFSWLTHSKNYMEDI